MLLERDQIEKAYEQIKADAVSGGVTVLILTAPDVDAMCCCRHIA